MMEINNIKINIIAIYFGNLPSYFNLWLNSCEKNEFITWTLISDSDLKVSYTPKNVIVHRISMNQIQERILNKTGINVVFDNPYKLCDFRPAYGEIFSDILRGFDYWGHCDLDMIFGNLSSYLSNKVLEYEKIYSVGHLTLYKNIESVNGFYKINVPGTFNWKDVFLDKKHWGFDEHIGVNKKWLKVKPNEFYYNESIIADIDPSIRRFELCSGLKNKFRQGFVYKNGRVFHVYLKSENIIYIEKMYIHFQKRSFINFPQDVSKSYFICDSGFYVFENDKDLLFLIDKYNNISFKSFIKEGKYRLKRLIRGRGNRKFLKKRS